jgi:hypothetical protein
VAGTWFIASAKYFVHEPGHCSRAKEGDMIVIKKIEKPVEDIRGMLKGSSFRFRRETEDREL